MGIAQRALDSFRSHWSHGEEEELERDEPEDTADTYRSEPPRYESAPPTRGGSGGGSNVRRVSPAVPLRVAPSRDKQIYTIKPHGLEEACAAADFLKTGSAVVVSLDDVDRNTAVRIIDFMSGVCYGLDAQGHAMKLGDTIFLFTPGDFEITSDEPDYNENRELFFRDVPAATALSTTSAPAASSAPTAAPRVVESAPNEGQIIERTVIGRAPVAERVTIEGSIGARAPIERPAVPPRPWER